MRLRFAFGVAWLVLATACGESSAPTAPDRPTCSLALSPRTQVVGPAGGTFTASVFATASGCSWTASADAPWIAVTSGSSGAGGTIVYDVSENDGAARNGAIALRFGEAAAVVSVVQGAR